MMKMKHGYPLVTWSFLVLPQRLAYMIPPARLQMICFQVLLDPTHRHYANATIEPTLFLA
jgi:hypothetical protein